MEPLPKRKNSLRRPGYDYSAEGAYFVTICTHKRLHYFGEIVEEVMHLSVLGGMAETYWLAIPSHNPGVETDAFVIMPNHMHGILVLDDGNKGASVSQIVGRYKAAVTRLARRSDIGIDLDYPVWQRNFHDRVIRNEQEYEAFRIYIDFTINV